MRLIALFILFVSLCISGQVSNGQNHEEHTDVVAQVQEVDAHADHSEEGDHAADAHHGKKPAMWSVIPFVLLLLMIATGPLFYEHFWHKNYPIIAIVLAVMVVAYYLFYLHNEHGPVHARR